MKISGVAKMHAPADQVWAALHDPAVLKAAIRGCDRMEALGPDSYRFAITAGVASIQGTYAGDIRLSQQRQPSSFVLTATAAGGPGTVSTSVQIGLAAADGYTALSYDADALVSGLIAGVGQLMLSSLAKLLVDEFFAGVDDQLSGNELAPAGSAAPAIGGLGPDDTSPAGLGSGPGMTSGHGFAGGVVVGAAITLAGVAVRGLLGRRARSDDG